MDGGFWINPDGSPGAPAGRPPEFRAPVMQWNLGAEGQPAGGANAANGPMWHGQWVASLAVAPHDDGAGVAGAGGTVATPWLFKCDLSAEQVIRGVQVATAWGINVINMSSSSSPRSASSASAPRLPTSATSTACSGGGEQRCDHRLRRRQRRPRAAGL